MLTWSIVSLLYQSNCSTIQEFQLVYDFFLVKNLRMATEKETERCSLSMLQNYDFLQIAYTKNLLMKISKKLPIPITNGEKSMENMKIRPDFVNRQR